MSCTNCNKSNCSCSDNCPNRVSDITTFDCNTFNVLEVPCDATLCDVLGLLEAYTTNMVNELDSMTNVVISEGNCIGLEAGTYGIQQVIDAILDKICEMPTCPLYANIVQSESSYTFEVNVSGGVGPYTYQWSIASNTYGIDISGPSDEQGVNIVITEGFTNFGLVKVEVTDSLGCKTSDVYLYAYAIT